MDTQVTRAGVQKIEGIAPLDIPNRKLVLLNKDGMYKHHSLRWTNSRLRFDLLPDEIFVQIENIAHFLQSFGSAHGPKTLEFSVVKPKIELASLYKV